MVYLNKNIKPLTDSLGFTYIYLKNMVKNWVDTYPNLNLDYKFQINDNFIITYQCKITTKELISQKQIRYNDNFNELIIVSYKIRGI